MLSRRLRRLLLFPCTVGLTNDRFVGECRVVALDADVMGVQRVSWPELLEELKQVVCEEEE
jgi:hypothetical protein